MTTQTELTQWLDQHRGTFCFVEIRSPEGAVIAKLRGVLQAATADVVGPRFYALDDGRLHLGIGQPGFAVPDQLETAVTIDDAAIKFQSPAVAVNLVLGA